MSVNPNLPAPVLHVTPEAKARVSFLRTHQNKPDLKLRITVEGGGCSGFQYRLALTEEAKDGDLTFEDSVVTDSLSMDFLKNAHIDFTETLLGAEFTIKNPNATQGCGCGVSFSIQT